MNFYKVSNKEREQRQIDAFWMESLSFTDNSSYWRRHRALVSTYFCQKFTDKEPNKTGRSVQLSSSLKRNIVIHIVNIQWSPSTIWRTLKLRVSARSVYSTLKNSDCATRMKQKPWTGLTQQYKQACLVSCKEKLDWTMEEWKNWSLLMKRSFIWMSRVA